MILRDLRDSIPSRTCDGPIEAHFAWTYLRGGHFAEDYDVSNRLTCGGENEDIRGVGNRNIGVRCCAP